MKKTLLTIGLAGLLSFSFSAKAEDISFGQVVLRGLDKVTGRLSTMTVNVGEKTTFGALDIYARVCYAHPPEETPENASFLEIIERKEEGQLKLFSGWMFSSSPALSAMDHAVYDVWVLKCQGDQVDPPAPEQLVLENPITVKNVQPKLKISWEKETQTVEEIPVDPENVAAETDKEAVSLQDIQETEEIIVHVERSQDQETVEASALTVVDGNENEETDSSENADFKLVPIQDNSDDAIENTAENTADVLVEDGVSADIPNERRELFSEESEAMENVIFSTDDDQQ